MKVNQNMTDTIASNFSNAFSRPSGQNRSGSIKKRN